MSICSTLSSIAFTMISHPMLTAKHNGEIQTISECSSSVKFQNLSGTFKLALVYMNSTFEGFRSRGGTVEGVYTSEKHSF